MAETPPRAIRETAITQNRIKPPEVFIIIAITGRIHIKFRWPFQSWSAPIPGAAFGPLADRESSGIFQCRLVLDEGYRFYEKWKQFDTVFWSDNRRAAQFLTGNVVNANFE